MILQSKNAIEKDGANGKYFIVKLTIDGVEYSSFVSAKSDKQLAQIKKWEDGIDLTGVVHLYEEPYKEYINKKWKFLTLGLKNQIAIEGLLGRIKALESIVMTTEERQARGAIQQPEDDLPF